MFASLPEGTPAPRLLGFFDQDGWVVLMFEDIAGHLQAQPWVAGELSLVLEAVATGGGTDTIAVEAPAGATLR